ncbi:MAG: thioredoxin family protein [Patescibacteria group bacterium]
MNIKILGTGCPNCQTLEDKAKKAVEELGLEDAKIEKVHDIAEITEYGVMSTPAIVVEGQVKASGRIPEVEEIKEWLK